MTRATLDPLTLPGGVVLAVRLMDEESFLACAADVDLNPIRAAMAETLEASDHTSVQRRIEAQRAEAIGSGDQPGRLSASGGGELGPCGNRSGSRCSDKGFFAMSVADSLRLLDRTPRQTVPGKCGSTPPDAPPVLERLKLSPPVWCALWSATLVV